MDRTSKVTYINKPPIKNNNVFDNGADLIQQLKVLIITSAIIGVNRLYLLKCNKFLSCSCYFFTSLILLFHVYVIIISRKKNLTYNLFIKTLCMEYIVLVFYSYFFHRKKVKTFFQNLATVDKILNVRDDVAKLFSPNLGTYWASAVITYAVLEYLLICKLFKVIDPMVLANNIGMMAREIEQIFLYSLLKVILIRVQIVKGHVLKYSNANHARTINSNWKELNRIEILSKNVHLNVTTMHRAYTLISKCADELNAIMSFQASLNLSVLFVIVDR